MGIIQHKSIELLIQQKFKLAKDKQCKQQYLLCIWKYTIEDLSKELLKFKSFQSQEYYLQEQQICKGECLQYPFKMFTDQGYICAIFQNKQNKRIKNNDKNLTIQKEKEKYVPLELLELLYLVSLNSFHSYYTNSIQFDTYSIHFEIICGDLLQPVQKLKLLSILHQLEKYVKLGSQNVIKKLFNEPLKLTFVNICYKSQLQSILNINQRERMVQINRIITKNKQKNNFDKLFGQLIEKFCQFNILKVFLLGMNTDEFVLLKNPFTDSKSYKKIRKSTIQNLIEFEQKGTLNQHGCSQNIHIHIEDNKKQPINQNNQKNKVHNQILGDQFEQYSNIIEKNQKQVDLDMSSPFICEITQIQPNQKITQKNKIKKNKLSQKHIQMGGDIDQSLFLPKELQNLKIDRNLYPLKLPKSKQQDEISNLKPQIILTTYPGSSVYANLVKNNIFMMVNLTPQEGYNYFVNDINYQWYFLRTFKPQQLAQSSIDKIKNIEEFNIQSLVFKFINTIEESLKVETQKNTNSKKVALFCNSNNFLYSGPFAIAYLIVKNIFRFTFQQALEVVMNSTMNKFCLTKVYQLQLRDLYSRIQSMSSISSINSLNTKSSFFKLYAVTPYNILTPYHLVCKYMGQVSNSNQLQSINHCNKSIFLLIPSNISSILMKIVNLMRQDTQNCKHQNVKKNMKNMGLNIKIMCGKEAQQKNPHINFVLKQLLLIVKYQFINFNKKVFNVQKYKNKIQTILECLQGIITVQSIQKSFRRPQPFTPLIFSQLNPSLLVLKSSDFKQKLAYNSKQTITFKYPILRPVFQSKRKDGYYILLKRTPNGLGCNVKMHKGKEWIGLEEDKQSFFQRIIESYLKDVGQDKIWIEDWDQSQVSLFDDNSIGF